MKCPRKPAIAFESFTYSGGAGGVAADREIRAPADLKGLKVGVFGDEVGAAWLRSLGAVPVPIRHDLDKILAMKRDGSLDAVIVTWRNFERASLNQGFKCFNLPGSTYLASVTYANKKFFDSLPAEYRELLVKASREAGRVERAKTIELNEAARREMVGKGVLPTYLSAAARADFVRAVEPAYRGAIDRLLGKGFLDSVRKATDGALSFPGGPRRGARPVLRRSAGPPAVGRRVRVVRAGARRPRPPSSLRPTTIWRPDCAGTPPPSAAATACAPPRRSSPSLFSSAAWWSSRRTPGSWPTAAWRGRRPATSTERSPTSAGPSTATRTPWRRGSAWPPS